MSLIFRQGVAGDVSAVARLAAHSFPAVGLTLERWEEVLLDSPRGGVETLWVGEENGTLAAACRLYRFEQWIGGSRFPMMGLGMVAISPTHRRRGLGRRLVASSFGHARDRGDAVSALFPFRTSFYRRLGYGMAGRAFQYHLPPAALPDHPARARVEIVDSSAARREVAEVYDRWAPGQSGQLVRQERAWELVWGEGSREGVLYRNEKGMATGYAVFRYLSASPRGDRTVEVEEVAWLEREAQLGIYGWLSSLSDQWDRVLYRAHPDEGFEEHLAELRFPLEGTPRWHFWFPNAAIVEGPMFRILDVERAWTSRTVLDGEPLAVALEVQDSDIPENGGGWTLRLEDGQIGVTRGASGSVDLRLRLNIEVLSRLHIGGIRAVAAAEAGLMEVDRPGRLPDLERLLTLPRPWMFDRF